MVRARQTWIRGAERPCPHDTIDEVRSEGGAVLAEKCALCQMLIAQYGPCAGCKAIKRLTHFVLTKRHAFCAPECALQARRRELEASAARLAAKAAQRGGAKAS